MPGCLSVGANAAVYRTGVRCMQQPDCMPTHLHRSSSVCVPHSRLSAAPGVLTTARTEPCSHTQRAHSQRWPAEQPDGSSTDTFTYALRTHTHTQTHARACVRAHACRRTLMSSSRLMLIRHTAMAKIWQLSISKQGVDTECIHPYKPV